MTTHTVRMTRRQAELVIIANTDDRMVAQDDAMADAECVGLMRDDDDSLAGIFERAGLTSESHVDSVMNNNCMLAAGFAMLADSDDSYNEVY